MSIGKNPHRPEGKARTDNEHMQAAWMNSGPPHDASRNDKARADEDRRTLREHAGGPLGDRTDTDEIGGSRPGVHSRVKEAIEQRETREAEEEEREEEA